jgi:hypothetical protein
MKLLGRISDEYKNVGIDELARLRRELPLVLDRTTFITYQCAREDSRKLRAKFYDALVESRKSGKFLSLAKFAIENGISNAPPLEMPFSVANFANERNFPFCRESTSAS